ncbi:unnamed protein product [Chrysoparadoxa australica]
MDGNILGRREAPSGSESGASSTQPSQPMSSGNILRRRSTAAAPFPAHSEAEPATNAAALVQARAEAAAQSAAESTAAEAAKLAKEGTVPVEGRVPFELMSDIQQHRLECWRRSYFDRGYVKQVVEDCIKGSEFQQHRVALKESSMVVVAELAKLFVGDLVESAREIMDSRGETAGPINPRHYLEAYRQMVRSGGIKSSIEDGELSILKQGPQWKRSHDDII